MNQNETLDSDGFTLCSNRLKSCGREMTCERANYKGENKDALFSLDLSCNLDSSGNCPYYMPRQALTDDRHIFRSGKRRHNSHAPPSERVKALKSLAQAKKAQSGRPTLMTLRPDLLVKRHIRMGFDINQDKEPTDGG